MQVVLQDEDIMVLGRRRIRQEDMAGNEVKEDSWIWRRCVPNGPGLSCQGWLVMLPTACLSGRFRDRPLTCDASTTKAAPLMQELGIGRRLASNRSLREELRTPQQATNREFK